jgi:hypothetical protein
MMMNCPIAEALFDEYAIATVEYFDAAEKLASLPVSPAQFKDVEFLVEEAAMKCRQTRLALQRHRLEHNCMDAIASKDASVGDPITDRPATEPRATEPRATDPRGGA